MTNRGKATMTPMQRPQSMVESEGTKVLCSVEASPLARASASTPASTALPVCVRVCVCVCACVCGALLLADQAAFVRVRRDRCIQEMS
jgi:hypothetical protein